MDQMMVTLVPRNTLNDHILVPLAATISDIRAGVCARLFVGCRPEDISVHDFEEASLLDDAAWERYVGLAAPHLRVSCCGPWTPALSCTSMIELMDSPWLIPF